MLERLFNPTVTRLEAGLDAGSLRHRVISNNLANVNTPGFKSSDVKFADALGRASLQMRRMRAAHLGIAGGTESGAQVALNTTNSVRHDGNNVDVEREMTNLAETELRYAALTQFAGRYFASLKAVINGQAR